MKDANNIEHKTKGESGATRRGAGTFIILIYGTTALLDGFAFYDIKPEIIWSLGIVGLCLLITGLAKDVTAIIKKKMD